MKNLIAALILSATATLAQADIQTNTPFADVHITNNRATGGQGLRVDATNWGSIAVMGRSNGPNAIGGYFDAVNGGTALQTLGKVTMNLYQNQSLTLSHTNSHIRLISGPPGDNRGFGVVLGTDGTYFAIGVTARDDANGPVQRYVYVLDLASGQALPR